jgi:hypothetical protein
MHSHHILDAMLPGRAGPFPAVIASDAGRNRLRLLAGRCAERVSSIVARELPRTFAGT